MHNDHITDADLRLNLYVGEVWCADETPRRAWINGDTGEAVELLEEFELDDADEYDEYDLTIDVDDPFLALALD